MFALGLNDATTRPAKCFGYPDLASRLDIMIDVNASFIVLPIISTLQHRHILLFRAMAPIEMKTRRLSTCVSGIYQRHSDRGTSEYRDLHVFRMKKILADLFNPTGVSSLQVSRGAAGKNLGCSASFPQQFWWQSATKYQ